MALTPVEIKHIRLERSFLGYKRTFVDQALEEVAASFEDVWRDRADLGGQGRAPRARARPLPRARGAPAHDARLRRARIAGAEGAGAEGVRARSDGGARGGARDRDARARRARAPDERGAADPLAPPLGARRARGRGRRFDRAEGRRRLGRREVDPAPAPRRPGRQTPRHRGPVRRGLEGACRRAAGARAANAPSSSSSPDARRPARGGRLVSGHGSRDKIVEVAGSGPPKPRRGSPRPRERTHEHDRHRAVSGRARDRARRVVAAIENLRNENPGSVEDETGEETYDQHLADVATAMHDRELDYRLEENEQQLLGAIDGALQRIEDGTYGVCSNCGKPIGEERLEALPWAELCIDCAKRDDRAGPEAPGSTSGSAPRPTG